METHDYDRFADIYDIWVATAPVAKREIPFYVEEYRQTRGPAVELGVGNGRILIEAALRGKAMIGVDASSKMLELCAARAELAGVGASVQLIQGDFRDFELPEPAELITIPFHTIGHLVTLDDKRAGLRHIHGQLAGAGRLILDHFVFDEAKARSYERRPCLRASYFDSTTGADTLLWFCVLHDFSAQTMEILTWTELIDENGCSGERMYRKLHFSWIEPAMMQRLFEECGFEIEACYGEFDRSPFEPGKSGEQIWIARKRSD